jgi:hypothetical protein
MNQPASQTGVTPPNPVQPPPSNARSAHGKDRQIVRELAKQVVEIAALPVQQQRIARWKKHNSLQSTEPMLLVFPEGSWREVLPDAGLQCQDPALRSMEWFLRSRIYYHEHFTDDTVIDGHWVVNKAIGDTGFGVEAKRVPSPEVLGAWTFDPVIHGPADLKALRLPTVTYDQQQTQRNVVSAQEVLGDILPVQLRGVGHISFHLMGQYTLLRGLEQVMMDMVEEPAMLHDAMAFLEEWHHSRIEQYVALNLLSLNNDGTYHSSGGNGWTDQLPAAGFDPQRVRPCDMWASAESQELAQVSPAMHAEFALPYEKRLLAPFALNGYGCCEDLTHKLEDVLTIPHIRRISISPWAEVAIAAQKLGRRCILSWKPKPSMLCGQFDGSAIRSYVRKALEDARGAVLEIILKDTHTCDHQPQRLDRWLRIAREEVQREMDRAG